MATVLRMPLTREIARAAATDASNRSMRKAGRVAWDEDDYNVAARAFNELWPEEKEMEELCR